MTTPSNPNRRRIAGERRRPEQQATTPAPGRAASPAERVAPVETAPTPVEPAPRQVGRSGSDRRLFVVSAVVAVVLVATSLWLGLQQWSYPELRRQDRVEQAERSAQGAAERAAAAILAYDYESLEADRKSAVRFLTPEFGKSYTDTFNAAVKPNAPKLRAKVTAKVLASGVVSATEHRARILVYVDQTTVSTAHGGRPQLALNRATFDLVETGGTWLVDGYTAH